MENITKAATVAIKTPIVILRTVFGILFILTGYMLPTGIALIKGRTNKASIFVVNFFLGWTIIGWFVALSWALSKDAISTQIAIEKRRK